MDNLKEYGTKEEVEKMESDINSLVSKVLPTVDNKTVEDVSTAIKSNNLPAIWEPVESLDMTNEEKIEFLNNVADFLSGIPEYDAVVESIESESDNILNDGKEGSAGLNQYAGWVPGRVSILHMYQKSNKKTQYEPYRLLRPDKGYQRNGIQGIVCSHRTAWGFL